MKEPGREISKAIFIAPILISGQSPPPCWTESKMKSFHEEMGISVLSDFRSLKVKQSLFTFIFWQFATRWITFVRRGWERYKLIQTWKNSVLREKFYSSWGYNNMTSPLSNLLFGISWPSHSSDTLRMLCVLRVLEIFSFLQSLSGSYCNKWPWMSVYLGSEN